MALALGEAAVKFKTAVLVESPLTLDGSGAQVLGFSPDAKGSSAHRELFQGYSEEADILASSALTFWEDLITSESRPERTRKEATRAAWERRPAGAASFPPVVALVREYWLACHALNLECDEKERVAPWTFLLTWLMDGNHEEAVNVLACMPYWPIGLDQDGNWV